MAISLGDAATNLLLITFGVFVVSAGAVAAVVIFSGMFRNVVR